MVWSLTGARSRIENRSHRNYRIESLICFVSKRSYRLIVSGTNLPVLPLPSLCLSLSLSFSLLCIIFIEHVYRRWLFRLRTRQRRVITWWRIDMDILGILSSILLLFDRYCCRSFTVKRSLDDWTMFDITQYYWSSDWNIEGFCSILWQSKILLIYILQLVKYWFAYGYTIAR